MYGIKDEKEVSKMYFCQTKNQQVPVYGHYIRKAYGEDGPDNTIMVHYRLELQRLSCGKSGNCEYAMNCREDFSNKFQLIVPI